MRRLLQFGFVLGFGGTLAAAYFVPWIEYTRYSSETSVVPNGGRIEQFVVHLPADRIDPAVAAAAEAGIGAGPGAPQMDHFKLRDVHGNIIGIAVRHRIAAADGNDTSWMLSIPSRGTLVLTRANDGFDSIESALIDRGWQSGVAQGISLDMDTPAESVFATGEFSGIAFELIETWEISGLDEDGKVRGTLRLNTVGRST